MAAESVLVVNAGSSSLKLRMLDPDDALTSSRDVPATHDPAEALEEFLTGAEDPDAIGHRIVHGGTEFTEPTRLDQRVQKRLTLLGELAPLHNPPALAAAEAALRLRPKIPNVACFDTSFHRTLPAAASTYALPTGWAERWDLRRFGFHGLSHSYAARRAAELLDVPTVDLRLVTAHLGAGASLAAVSNGISVDTTMGFTPLDGLVMATRSGAVDPGLLLWVQRHGELDPQDVEQALDREAGLLGVSARSGVMSEIVAGVAEGDGRCRLAFDVYSHRLVGAVAAMTASMGGLDAIVFTGGVGENSPEVRYEACRRLAFLGLEIDPALNADPDHDQDLSAAGATTRTLLVFAREDLEVAAGVRAALSDSA